MMCLFAWNGEVAWTVVGLFSLVTLGTTGAFALMIRRGWNLRFKDPDVLQLQIYCNSLIQLAFLVVEPRLWVLFVMAVCVAYIFALFSFEPRQFTPTWLVLGLAMGVAMYLVRDRFGHLGSEPLDIFLLWMFFFLCMRQLMMFGVQFSELRIKLSERNKALAASLVRLEALAGQQRLVERERISRELHDTLMQGFQGLMLHLQAATECIPPHEPARRMMETTLERADHILLEGRDRLAQLRVASSAGADLPEALMSAGEELSADYHVGFRFQLHGARRDLQRVVADEVYRVGREALLNAFQHAGAGEIVVSLTFGEAGLRLLIKDDGVGMSPDTGFGEQDSLAGGLANMRDRARRIGAQFSVRSEPGGGSEIDLSIAAALAYR